jgi:hypothetical protein
MLVNIYFSIAKEIVVDNMHFSDTGTNLSVALGSGGGKGSWKLLFSASPYPYTFLAAASHIISTSFANSLVMVFPRPDFLFYFYLFFSGTRGLNSGPHFAGQVLYHLSHSANPFFLFLHCLFLR